MKKLWTLTRYYWYAIFGKNIDAPIWSSQTGEHESFIFNNKDAANRKVMSVTMAGFDTEHTNGGRLHTVVVRPREPKEPFWTPKHKYPIEFSLN